MKSSTIDLNAYSEKDLAQPYEAGGACGDYVINLSAACYMLQKLLSSISALYPLIDTVFSVIQRCVVRYIAQFANIHFRHASLSPKSGPSMIVFSQYCNLDCRSSKNFGSNFAVLQKSVLVGHMRTL